MVYKINNRSIAIPDAELDKMVDTFECSLQEAIELWLADNDLIINEQQEELNKKASAIKVSNIVKAASAKPKTQRERVLKPDEEKERIIKTLAAALDTLGANVKVEDARKLICFKLGDDDYKINLTRTRKPKN